ncbi:hypothetical protein, partial [Glaesserella parasuis]|uniref:hypothetical protein n=1 Tax=Glaesserella parasuis TaxID=738 RepID=UPI003F3D264D
ICEITSITNAQNYTYWADEPLYRHLENNDNWAIDDRKYYLKRRAFEIVADQTGKIFNPDKVLTIVWARRFAGYKRADFLTTDLARFEKLISNT